MRTIHWKKLLFDMSIWLVAEIILNVIGIDDLADYSEFLQGAKSHLSLNSAVATFVAVL